MVKSTLLKKTDRVSKTQGEYNLSVNLNLQVYIFSSYDECVSAIVEITRGNGIKIREKKKLGLIAP